MRKKAVIFDMDGTLFDTERLYLGVFEDIALKYNIEVSIELYKKLVGITIEKNKEMFISIFGESFDADGYFSDVLEEKENRISKNGVPKKAGVDEILKYLKQNGIKTAVASSTFSDIVENELKQAGIYEMFDVIVGGDMVKRSKPNPDIFLSACQKLGVKPEDAYVIEDSYSGVSAGYASGADTIMVPDMIEPDEELRKKAYIVLNSLTDVMEMFKGEK